MFIPFRYQGRYEDVETGLYYNRFRYYSPDRGCYISQDPIGLAGNNPNIYAYVSDSNAWADPLGLSQTCSIHRGTNNGLELAIQKETGYIMSDAARKSYIEAMYSGMDMDDAIKKALKDSEAAHVANIKFFGSLENYMIAHTKKGTEIGGAASRSMISFTTDKSVTSTFGDNVFSKTTSKNNVISQTLIDGSESEVFVFHMIKI